MPAVNPLVLTPSNTLLDDYPALISLSRQLSECYVQQALVSDDLLKMIRLQLWQALNSEAALTQAKKTAGMQILPIVISSDNAAIQQLPWETLCHPDSGFFATSPRYTLNRAIPNQQPLPEVTSGPLRILLFTALAESTTIDNKSNNSSNGSNGKRSGKIKYRRRASTSAGSVITLNKAR